jgi:hypothetical protein
LRNGAAVRAEAYMVRSSFIALLGFVAVFGCSSDHPNNRASPLEGGKESDARAPKLDASKPSLDGNRAPEAGTDSSTAAFPALLSDTGLFSDVTAETLGTGVRAFQPKYTLWSDGATKRRWLYLPPGSTIDTSDMDFWLYPQGTKVWKEFSLNGKRIETRLLHKAGPKSTDWVMIAYQWKDDLTDAEAVPDGVLNAKGTPHDIPSRDDCQTCHHRMKDRLLGVTAIQLSHQPGGVTITDLISEGRLSSPPAAPFSIPGDVVSEQALGYLHANCGLCHNPKSDVAVSIALDLWESTKHLSSIETTTGYATTVLQQNSFIPALHVIEPGKPDQSELVYRISHRGDQAQMPPLATEIVDANALANIRAWIAAMPPVPDAGAPDSGKAPVDAGAKD